MRKPSACLAFLLCVSIPRPGLAQVTQVAELQEDLTLVVDASGTPQPLKSGTLLALLDQVSLRVRLDGRTSGRLPRGARIEVYEVYSTNEDTAPSGSPSSIDNLPKKPEKGPEPKPGSPIYRQLDDPAEIEAAFRATLSSDPKGTRDAFTRILIDNPGLLSHLRPGSPSSSSPQ